MQIGLTAVKNSINKILSNENLFVWVAGAVILTFWAINFWVMGMVVLCLMMAVSLAFLKDTSRITAILFMIVMVISGNSHKLGGFSWVLFVSVGLLLTGIVVHIIRFKPKFKPLFTESKAKGFSLTLVLLIIPAALGGITRGDRNVVALLAAVAFFTLVALCYLFFLATTEDKKGDAMLRYVLLMMLVAGIVMSMQIIIFYVRLGSYEKIVECMDTKGLKLGWASNNNVAPLLALTLPSCFYYAIKNKRSGFIFIILAVIEYILIFSTKCRAAILFTTVALPFILCYTMAKAANKTAVGLTISLCFCIIIAAVAYYGEQFIDIFKRMLSLGLNDNGRMPLYYEAIETFKKFPLFGAGWDFKLGELANDGYTPYWYHNTVLQIMANMGITGLIVFTLFTFWRYFSCLFTRNYRTPKLAVASGMIIFELCGMVDVNFFGPTFFITMVIMSLAIEKSLEKDQCNPILYTKIMKKIAIKNK